MGQYKFHIHIHYLCRVSPIEHQQNIKIILAQQISASTEVIFVCKQYHAAIHNITKIVLI